MTSSRDVRRPRAEDPLADPVDELDSLFNDGNGLDNAFKDVDTNMDIPEKSRARTRAETPKTNAGLGIDEEIKIVRRRAPVAKLDENRYAHVLGPSEQ